MKKYTATRNACKTCSPLGASLVFKGIEGCVPLIHGSQGCATYIRRYLISHYKEPVDIASTNFSEDSAVFGGERNLFTALDNITRQYRPSMVAIATTCLSETIGDDMEQLISSYRSSRSENKDLPELVQVSTPSYRGTHASAFHDAVLALVRQYAFFETSASHLNLFPGMQSPADLRFLKDLMTGCGLTTTLLPDYSDTLDDGYSGKYEKVPAGGTSLEGIRATASARATIEFGRILNHTRSQELSAGQFLEKSFSVPRINLDIPMGIAATDCFMQAIEKLGGTVPDSISRERARLVDAYVDGHKYVFGKRAVVYGEEDLALALAAFLEEIGMEVVLCASGGDSGLMKEKYLERSEAGKPARVMDRADYEDIAEACRDLKPEIMVGNSKGYYIARELGIPLVRVGFPIHDRLGGQRTRHLGYGGTMELFDRVANALIASIQESSPVGYKYM